MLDSLYLSTVHKKKRRVLVHFTIVCVTACLHSLLLFVHVTTLTVAVNSSDQVNRVSWTNRWRVLPHADVVFEFCAVGCGSVEPFPAVFWWLRLAVSDVLCAHAVTVAGVHGMLHALSDPFSVVARSARNLLEIYAKGVVLVSKRQGRFGCLPCSPAVQIPVLTPCPPSLRPSVSRRS